MNFSTIGSNSLPPIFGSSTTRTASSATDVDSSGSDGSAPVGRPHHRGHGGGRMENDLTGALARLGLALPSGNESAPPATATDSAAGTGLDADAGMSLESDLTHFMRELVVSLRDASSSASAVANTTDTTVTGSSASTGLVTMSGSDASTGASASGGIDSGVPRAGVGSGLSALISQVAGGKAPQGLQDAFSKLVADLTAASGTTSTASTAPSGATSSTTGSIGATTSASSGTTSASDPTATASSSVTLQALLTQLQQSIGYGRNGSPPVGNLLDIQA